MHVCTIATLQIRRILDHRLVEPSWDWGCIERRHPPHPAVHTFRWTCRSRLFTVMLHSLTGWAGRARVMSSTLTSQTTLRLSLRIENLGKWLGRDAAMQEVSIRRVPAPWVCWWQSRVTREMGRHFLSTGASPNGGGVICGTSSTMQNLMDWLYNNQQG